MKKRKKKNKIIYLIIIVLAIVLGIGGIFAYNYYQSKIPIESVNDLIKEKKKNNYEDAKEPIELEPYVNNLPNYRSQYNNSQIMGKLEVPNMNIDALVTRTDNNEYYLNYNLYHQWDGLGVPFFDYRNMDLANDRQINIYGHNTQNENFMHMLPFINLEAYIDKNIFDNYKTVFLSIDEKRVEYELIAVKILTDGNAEHMKLLFNSDQDFVDHVGRMIKGSLYINDNLTITSLDRILVLQVCHYNPPNSYLLVICREKV